MIGEHLYRQFYWYLFILYHFHIGFYTLQILKLITLQRIRKHTDLCGKIHPQIWSTLSVLQIYRVCSIVFIISFELI